MSGGGGGGGMIGGIFGAIGGGVQAEGALRGGEAGADAARYNAAISETNAALALQSADYDALQIRRSLDKTIGGQTAAYAASGVGADSGSALDVLADTVAQGTLVAQRREFAGKLESLGLTAEAARSRANAKEIIWNSKMAAFGAKVNDIAGFFGGSGGYTGGPGGSQPVNTGDASYESFSGGANGGADWESF